MALPNLAHATASLTSFHAIIQGNVVLYDRFKHKEAPIHIYICSAVLLGLVWISNVRKQMKRKVNIWVSFLPPYTIDSSSSPAASWSVTCVGF
jgi:hypothetical protein